MILMPTYPWYSLPCALPTSWLVPETRLNLGVILCEVYSRGTWCLPVSLMVAVDINACVITEAAKRGSSNSTVSSFNNQSTRAQLLGALATFQRTQSPHGSSRLSATLVLGDLMSSSRFCGHQTHMWYINTHDGIKINPSFLKNQNVIRKSSRGKEHIICTVPPFGKSIKCVSGAPDFSKSQFYWARQI